ncbi:5-demethoxyubiquinol-8 5-hydroxylase UbiM [Halomonas huangheensis]|uniref:FAD-binding domain-containing protein n=1 Tax=Halomonas huangheensis TaxID=1178482 RepID=W1NBD2_9GAMM|nr:5-demethoxyubiquinol-8 5-hydroxylase UbiM [Halomonas huangheensis]ALM52631.1 hypothetical protein AR456_10330 [Halomonas huangheensis]ERL52852.1 hypothetical protein BJB45_16365 [Halomonas huangheensis]
MRDVAIIGAGPVGLCLARHLATAGLSVTLLDRLSAEELSRPAPDGREIALTHDSCRLLDALGIRQRLENDEIAPLNEARVFNGQSSWFMGFGEGHGTTQPLGFMVPNHAIRRAAWQAVSELDGIEYLPVGVASVSSHSYAAQLELEDGSHHQARLVVAADSRFSISRRQMGIAAEMRDNGRTMMVCRINHEVEHDQSAWEWFDHGQTLALLPISAHLSSAVVTLPEKEMAELMQLDDDAFSAQLTERYAGRLGRMTLEGKAHVYPLVSTYAERFHARRFALVGDAAVGMHPVTAHGFNFGVQSQQRLARCIIDAFQRGEDIASERLLAAYSHEHRLATRPLYLATQAIVKLYTDERVPARLLRHLGLRVGDKLSPVRELVSRHLQGETPHFRLPHPTLPRLPFLR